MHILILGLNHKSAPLALREQIGFLPHQIPYALKSLRSYQYINGCIIISTCNRTEIYVTTNILEPALKSIINFLKISKKINWQCCKDNFYIYKENDAIRHLFMVVSGMDSMVIGETQILGQVKDAYKVAYQEGVSAKKLNLLFQKAFNVAKRVRENSTIGHRPVSVCSIAISQLKRNLKSLDNKKVLIIGSGKVSSLMAKSLLKEGIKKIFVANRTFKKAEEFSKNFNSSPIKIFEIIEYIKKVDILISCTSAPHLIIKKEDVIDVLSHRRRHLFIFDLAIPRDIDPCLSNHRIITLYNIDDLKKISETNLKARQKEIAICRMIVEKQSLEFSKRFLQDSLAASYA